MKTSLQEIVRRTRGRDTGSGNDTLSAKGGHNYLDGGDGNDTLQSGAGFILFGGCKRTAANDAEGRLVA